jgi:flagellar basal body-associated protein FliL
MDQEDRHERMQRIRVGLTGLAVVLLIVMLATVVFTHFDKGAGPGNVAKPANSADEPLSDLGVVPSTPKNAVNSNNVKPN